LLAKEIGAAAQFEAGLKVQEGVVLLGQLPAHVIPITNPKNPVASAVAVKQFVTVVGPFTAHDGCQQLE
jgi:hypothetical protein